MDNHWGWSCNGFLSVYIRNQATLKTCQRWFPGNSVRILSWPDESRRRKAMFRDWDSGKIKVMAANKTFHWYRFFRDSLLDWQRAIVIIAGVHARDGAWWTTWLACNMYCNIQRPIQQQVHRNPRQWSKQRAGTKDARLLEGTVL